VILGQYLAPEALPLVRTTGPAAPPGLLLVRGPDDYAREAMGRVLELVYYSEDEVVDVSRQIPGTEVVP